VKDACGGLSCADGVVVRVLVLTTGTMKPICRVPESSFMGLARLWGKYVQMSLHYIEIEYFMQWKRTQWSKIPTVNNLCICGGALYGFKKEVVQLLEYGGVFLVLGGEFCAVCFLT